MIIKKENFPRIWVRKQENITEFQQTPKITDRINKVTFLLDFSEPRKEEEFTIFSILASFGTSHPQISRERNLHCRLYHMKTIKKNQKSNRCWRIENKEEKASIDKVESYPGNENTWLDTKYLQKCRERQQ